MSPQPICGDIRQIGTWHSIGDQSADFDKLETKKLVSNSQPWAASLVQSKTKSFAFRFARTCIGYHTFSVLFQACPLYSGRWSEKTHMGISLETKLCEHVSFQEASRLMINKENHPLIPLGVYIFQDFFIPENAQFKDYRNEFLRWNIVVTRSGVSDTKLSAISVSSSSKISSGSICYINLFGNDPDLMVEHGIAHLDRALKVVDREREYMICISWTSWDYDDMMRDRFTSILGPPATTESGWDEPLYAVETSFANQTLTCWICLNIFLHFGKWMGRNPTVTISQGPFW